MERDHLGSNNWQRHYLSFFSPPPVATTQSPTLPRWAHRASTSKPTESQCSAARLHIYRCSGEREGTCGAFSHDAAERRGLRRCLAGVRPSHHSRHRPPRQAIADRSSANMIYSNNRCFPSFFLPPPVVLDTVVITCSWFAPSHGPD